ncbi:hypothetical protein BJ138DRAFT_1119087 [Hygrophoropsis aurantiaca]|uniref:Uncharacterized protein n=1 Tax=Hygrophoropsis aurantiaca TaxID=72124 RepID=A0ACB7ZWQ5_9AGAM|nr:hypothetical protein BJ138DRAFT_1119087 [Hygrophoropsis aurantiaca]
MARPAIHKTEEAKRQAAKEKRLKHYNNTDLKNRDAINARRRIECLPENRLVKRRKRSPCTKKATEPQEGAPGDDASANGKDSDFDPDNMTLTDCLSLVKDAKDELLELVGGAPRTYVGSVLHKFVATMEYSESAEDDDSDRDVSVITRAIDAIEDIHAKGHAGQDTIYEMCGVCEEWFAADQICRAMRNIVAMLEDIYCLALEGGVALAEAHMLGHLMYQRLDNEFWE